MKKLLTIALLAISTVSFGSLRTAVTSGDWNTSSTWSPSSVPNSSDSVLIPVGKAVTNIANATCGTITINGTLRNPGTLTVKGFFNVNGSFIPATGTVTFNGSSIQKITGPSTINFYNFIDKNNVSLALSVNANIYGTFSMTNGSVFSTNSYAFTLKSISPTETGRIASLPNSYTFTGNITQERYIKGAGWHMIGNTVTTSTVSAMEYDETAHGNLNVGYTVGTLTPGVGGFIQTVGDTVLSVTGPFTKGTQLYSLSLSGLDMTNDGWNLLANPYPSEINIDSPSFSMSGTTNMIYVWDWTSQSYLWWKKGSGGTYQNVIAQGQAFWTQAINNTAYVKMGEASKVSSTSPFYRASSTVIPAIQVTLNANNFNSILFTTMGDFMNDYDPNTDGQYLESASTLKSELYTKSADNYRLVYDCREITDTISVPFWIKPHTLSPHTLTLTGLTNIPSDYRWVIYNNRTGQMITTDVITFTPTSLDEKNTYTLYIIKKHLPGEDLLNGIDTPKKSIYDNLVQIVDQNGRVVTTNDNLTSGVYIFIYEEPSGVYVKKRLVIN